MRTEIDILENEILARYSEVLEILLRDQTTQKDIIWATNNYEHLGESYRFNDQILPELITGKNGHIIMPRVRKDKMLKQNRSREMAEVFTPSWICNVQNNLIDKEWFQKKDVFNKEIKLNNGGFVWEVNKEKITFPNGKTWKHYVRETRLEVACGEAPYIASRYDTTTGDFIPVENRIGLLDRKLRVINENVNKTNEWINAVQTAYKSIYAFEWHGDNLLLAREALFITFIENFNLKFAKEPMLKSIQDIATIISWNVWQMDGLKGVIPNSCEDKISTTVNLFGDVETTKSGCEGCQENNIYKHNGTYSLIKDWGNEDTEKGKKGRNIRFIDLLKGYIK